MATRGEDLDLVVSYTLQRFSCEAMTLEAEQRVSVKYMYEGKDVFVWLPTGFGKSVCYKVLPFAFDVKLGRGIMIAIVTNGTRKSNGGSHLTITLIRSK